MYHRASQTALLAMLLATAWGPGAASSVAAKGESLQQRQDGFLAAMGARDIEVATAYFAEDALLQVANMPQIQGRDAIHRFYGNVFRFLRESTPTLEMTRESAGADMAYSVGRVRNVFEGEQGRVEYSGKFLLVWEKREGGWEIAVYSISNDSQEPSRQE